MQILAVISVAVLILAALLVAIFKGSRPPQPIPSTPTSPKQTTFAAFMSVVCAAILLVTFTSLGPYVSEHLAPTKPLVVRFWAGSLRGSWASILHIRLLAQGAKC